MSHSQSPTQSNHGRSYDHYFQNASVDGEVMEASSFLDAGVHDATPGTSHGLRTLEDDDTGAVRFDYPVRRDSQVEDLPTGDRARAAFVESALPATMPETPLPVNRNPFGNRHKTSQILPPSQLFARTQSASKPRRFSPTSSRPSPNLLHAIDISPIGDTSSPLKARGLVTSPIPEAESSPAPLPALTSPIAPTDGIEPLEPPSEALPESPQPEERHLSQEIVSVGDYEPMDKSQERRSSTVPWTAVGQVDGEDDSWERRRRVALKRAAANKSLDQIQVPTVKKGYDRTRLPRRNSRTEKQGGKSGYQLPTSTVGVESDDDETIADSQDLLVPQKVPVAQVDIPAPGIMTPELLPSTASDDIVAEELARSPDLADDGVNHSSFQEAIPETSPLAKKPPAPVLVEQSSGSVPSVIPATSSGEFVQATRETQGTAKLPSTVRILSQTVPETSVAEQTDNQDAGPKPTLPDAPVSTPRPQVVSLLRGDSALSDFQSSPPLISTRTGITLQAGQETIQDTTMPESAPSSSMSSLSSLDTTTPDWTSSTTPATHNSDTRLHSDAVSSPATATSKLRRKRESLPRLKTNNGTSLRQSARLSRHASVSTDELARSPSPSLAPNQCVRTPHAGPVRQPRGIIAPPPPARGQSTNKLFQNMAFAVSFQGKKPHENSEQYKERLDASKLVEKKIREAGGRILENGFDELFETSQSTSADTSPTTPFEPDNDISMVPAAAAMGFVALVADGHSRKVKYMQALALGLPCVATRWITTCLDRGELIEWTPYLLCAGQSSFLGDAIRSRNLLAYDPAAARFPDVVGERARLLDGQRVLIVMKRAAEVRKMAYIFLARVLGASISRVCSLDEARARLRSAEEQGRPFDWVYIDDRMEKGDLFTRSKPMPPPPAKGKGKGAGKKRKRNESVAEAEVEPAPKRVRTLSDELVIQSLILGRVIEEAEMDE